MIIDGEKYACEACVRGHRVSNCQHHDRPLQHINKKGRPVSQCAHCRSMRKSRSAHVKCDCGERSSKCAHLQPTVEGHKDTCCCNHGGRCTCAHKKESPTLETVPESESDAEKGRPKPTVRRRRANTIQSDGVLSFDKDRHHKPCHKNKVSQKISPYQLNRVNSVNSTASVGSESGLSSRSTSVSRSQAGGSRRVKSETASPQMAGSPTFSHLNGHLPPLDMSRIQYPSYTNFDLFGSTFSSDQETPLFSAGLSATSADWSACDSFAPSSYGQGAPGFGNFLDFGTGSDPLPTLAPTTTTSGDVSEVEDNFLDVDGLGRHNGYMGHHGQLLGNGADFENYKTKYLTHPAASHDDSPIAGNPLSLVEDDPAFYLQNYNDGVATMPDSPEAVAGASDNFFYSL